MAVNQQVIKGSWDQIKGKLRERWGQVTEDELEEARGNTDQLVGLIQQRTGEMRGEIEAYLESAAADGASMVDRTKEAVVDTACRTGESVQEVIAEHPLPSALTAFGVGVGIGFMVAILLPDRPRQQDAAITKRVLDAVLNALPNSVAKHLS